MPLRKAADAIKRKIEQGQQEQLAGGLDGSRIVNQLPGRVLPPTGNTGSGYTPAVHEHTAAGTGGALTNDEHLGFGQYSEIAAPSTPSANKLRLYAKDKAGTSALYYKDDGGSEHDLSTAGTGLIDQGTATFLDFTNASAPGTPASGKTRIYTKTDKAFYQKDDGGIETALAGGGGATHAYYDQLCALLEPDALEPLRVGTGSVTISAGVTKYLVLGWALQFGANSRLEIRDPRDPLPLRNVTISGIGAASTMILLDPTLPTYADSWTTYHDRLLAIATMDTKVIEVTAGATFYPFLPGPYGCIITGNTVFNLAWVALRSTGGASSDLALNFELGDANTDWVRFGQTMRVPITKKHACGVESGSAGGIGSGGGSLTYVILPSTWSAVTDPNSYSFRDDFMGASLDTSTVWTRAQSTAGNVEISTQFQWCKLLGSSSWGANGIYSQASTSRSAGKIFLVDVFVGSSTPNLVVGWSDGGGQSYTNFAHGVDFTNSGGNAIFVFENGNSRGAVGSGWTVNNTYRVRITLGASNAAYAIQGGPEYQAIGSASWTDITPGTTSSSTTPLHAGATIESAVTTYVGDMRVY